MIVIALIPYRHKLDATRDVPNSRCPRTRRGTSVIAIPLNAKSINDSCVYVNLPNKVNRNAASLVYARNPQLTSVNFFDVMALIMRTIHLLPQIFITGILGSNSSRPNMVAVEKSYVTAIIGARRKGISSGLN